MTCVSDWTQLLTWRAQNCDPPGLFSLTALNSINLLLVQQLGGEANVSLFAVGASCGGPTRGAADRRQSLPTATVFHCRKLRPRLDDADRRFWVLARRWFSGRRTSPLVVKPETVLRCHRQAWHTYWRRRSPHWEARPPNCAGTSDPHRRMTMENRLWGQRRIQVELARLGFKVSARTVAKYMQRPIVAGRPPL